FAPEAVAAFAERLRAAAQELHELVEPRLRGAKQITNALDIERGLARLVDRLAAPGIALEGLLSTCAEALAEKLVKHLKGWPAKLNKGETARLGDVRDALAEHVSRLAPLLDHLRRLDPALLQQARGALLPLLTAVEQELA